MQRSVSKPKAFATVGQPLQKPYLRLKDKEKEKEKDMMKDVFVFGDMTITITRLTEQIIEVKVTREGKILKKQEIARENLGEFISNTCF